MASPHHTVRSLMYPYMPKRELTKVAACETQLVAGMHDSRIRGMFVCALVGRGEGGDGDGTLLAFRLCLGHHLELRRKVVRGGE